MPDINGTSMFAGGGFNFSGSEGTEAKTPGPRTSGFSKEEKAVLAMLDALDQRHVEHYVIAYGLERGGDCYQQRILMDIIMFLLNLWATKHSDGGNSPLRNLYAQAATMLGQLPAEGGPHDQDPEPDPPRERTATDEAWAQARAMSVADILRSKNRRRRG